MKLTWTADGRHVLATNGAFRYARLLSADGGEAREWDPKTNLQWDNVHFDPAGRRVAFSCPAEVPTYEIRVLEGFLTREASTTAPLPTSRSRAW
jgi:hypothetical protein